MASKKAKSGHPLDSKTIDTHNKSDYRHWCKELDCTDRELTTTVHAVGGSSAAVREYVESHH